MTYARLKIVHAPTANVIQVYYLRRSLTGRRKANIWRQIERVRVKLENLTCRSLHQRNANFVISYRVHTERDRPPGLIRDK